MGLPPGEEWRRAGLRAGVALAASALVLLVGWAAGLIPLPLRSLCNVSLGVGFLAACSSLIEGRGIEGPGARAPLPALAWALLVGTSTVALQGVVVASDAYQAGLLETGDPRAASQRASDLMGALWKLRELYLSLAVLVALPLAAVLFARLQGWRRRAQFLAGALALAGLGALPWIYLHLPPASGAKPKGLAALFFLPLGVVVGLAVLDFVERRLLGERPPSEEVAPERRGLWIASALTLALLGGATFGWIRSDPTQLRVGWEWEPGGALRLTLDTPRWGPALAQELEVHEVLATLPHEPGGDRTFEYVPRERFRLGQEASLEAGLLRVRRTWPATYSGGEREILLRGVVRLRDGSEKTFSATIERGAGYWHSPLWVR